MICCFYMRYIQMKTNSPVFVNCMFMFDVLDVFLIEHFPSKTVLWIYKLHNIIFMFAFILRKSMLDISFRCVDVLVDSWSVVDCVALNDQLTDATARRCCQFKLPQKVSWSWWEMAFHGKTKIRLKGCHRNMSGLKTESTKTHSMSFVPQISRFCWWLFDQRCV